MPSSAVLLNLESCTRHGLRRLAVSDSRFSSRGGCFAGQPTSAHVLETSAPAGNSRRGTQTTRISDALPAQGGRCICSRTLMMLSAQGIGGRQNSDRLFGRLLRHPWSTASILITVADVIFDQLIVVRLIRNGSWVPYSPSANRVSAGIGWALLASAAFGIVATIREKPLWIGAVAFIAAAFMLFATAYSA